MQGSILTGKSMLLSTALALILSSMALSMPKPEAIQPALNNLDKVEQGFFDSVEVSRSSGLGNRKRVYIDTATAEFSRYWERTHKSDITLFYKTKTLERYSQMLQEALQKACIESTGFELVSSREEAELVFAPKIERLNIYAPDDFIGKSWVFRAGSARLNLNVLDAKSNTVLVHIVDARETINRAYSRPTQANRGTNTRDFRMLMTRWSERAFDYLETLKAKP